MMDVDAAGTVVAAMTVALLVLSVVYSVVFAAPKPPLSQKEVELIRTTWKVVGTLPTEAVGVLLFKNIFELAGDAAPEVAKLFKFSKAPGFKLKPFKENKELKEHSVGVVNTVTTAIGMLDNLPALVPVLKDLGSRHVKYGVVPLHYDVVGGAFLATLEQGLPKGLYTDEVRGAFTALWGVVATTMQSECGYDKKKT